MGNPDLPISIECEMYHCQYCEDQCVDFILVGDDEQKMCISCLLAKAKQFKSENKRLNTMIDDLTIPTKKKTINPPPSGEKV